MPTRQAGLLGRQHATIPTGLQYLTYYVAGALPKGPPSVTVPNYGLWGMLGNDQYGDCGIASLEHGFMCDSVITHEQREAQATDQQAVTYYLTYNNGQDVGVNLSQYLAYVRTHGYYGHSIEAYAPVAVHDVPTLQTVVWMYGFAYTGIVVTREMQEAFQNNQPWTADLLNFPIIGGHAVPIVGYDDQYLYVITWGGVQAISYSAWHAMSSEAWATITGEFVGRHGDGRGVSLAALKADLNRFTQ